jgi:hypothetical protein
MAKPECKIAGCGRPVFGTGNQPHGDDPAPDLCLRHLRFELFTSLSTSPNPQGEPAGAVSGADGGVSTAPVPATRPTHGSAKPAWAAWAHAVHGFALDDLMALTKKQIVDLVADLESVDLAGQGSGLES